jgi:peptidoglycan/LPS O-acetylase OafA/YrhL
VSANPIRAWAAIDLLRFACALMVVARHYGEVLPLGLNPAAANMLAGVALPTRYAPWTGFGWIGVELFFVISGYVIACSAEGADPRSFLRRRAQRLLPAAWVCASLSALALLAFGGDTPANLAGQWLRSMLFWPLGDAIDPSYWTLGIEVAFYLLVAARLRGGASPARIERVAWWIGGASAAFWAALFAAGLLDGSWASERLAQLLLLPHGCFFAIGMLVQAGHRSGFTRRRVAGLALFLGAAVLEILAHAVRHAADVHMAVDAVWPLAAFGAGLAVMLLCRLLQPGIARWSGVATTLGLMTYPLYLLHQQVGAAIVASLARMGAPAEAGLVSALLLSLALSWACVRFAEPPLRAAIGQALRARHALRPDIRPTPSR